jgi:hypothetical protein
MVFGNEIKFSPSERPKPRSKKKWYFKMGKPTMELESYE